LFAEQRWILGISSWPLCTTKSVSRARHQATPTETVTLWRVITPACHQRASDGHQRI